MTTIPFSKLDQKQLDQVAYLFADKYFVTDPAAYLYELNERGDVSGRSITGDVCEKKSHTSIAPAQVHAQEEAKVTDEIIRSARMNMDALTASIATGIYQSQCQLEEVNHE